MHRWGFGGRGMGFGGPCWWELYETKEGKEGVIKLLKAKLNFLESRKALLEKYIEELEKEVKESKEEK